MSFLVTITPPTLTPVSLTEAKLQLRLEDMVDDGHVTTLVKAATRHVEQACSRALVETRVEQRSAAFCSRMQLGGGHLATVPNVTVKYLDATEVEQTVDSAVYRVIPKGEERAELILAADQSWPTDVAERPDAVRVQYTVGWTVTETPAANLVPEDLRLAVKLMLSWVYEHRDDELNDPSEVTSNSTYRLLIGPYKFLSL